MKSSKRKIVITVITLFLVLVLPLSIYLVSQRQELRKKAAGETGGVCTDYSFSLPTLTPTPTPIPLRVFVTSLTYNGNLSSGLAGGDAKCRARAAAASLPNANNFKAWLSDSTTNAKDRFITKDKPYYLVLSGGALGAKVANNFADLIDGTLLNPINKNESGITVTTSVYVWTGTDRYGVKKTGNQNFCYNWLSTSNYAYAGLLSTASYSWTDSVTLSVCNTARRLYCFEDVSTSPTPTITLTSTPTAIPSAPPLPTSAPSSAPTVIPSVPPTSTLAPSPTPTAAPTSILTPTPSPTVTPAPILTPTSAPATSLKVFVTSQTYTGNLGGLPGADAKCQARAAAVGLTGTFKTWLSTSDTHARNRFITTNKPYVLVNGIQVADNLTDLTDGSLDHQIDINENGTLNTSSLAWTGTLVNGTGSLSYCVNWTSISSSYQGTMGRISYVTSSWTNYSQVPCNGTARLYCFEDIP